MIYSTYQPIFFETKENKCSGKMLDANNQKNLVKLLFLYLGLGYSRMGGKEISFFSAAFCCW